MAGTTITKTVTIYDNEQFILTQVAKTMFEGNESQAARFIIRDWARANLAGILANEQTPIEKAAVR